MTLLSLVPLHSASAQPFQSQLQPIPQQDLSAFVAGMLDIQTKRDDAAGASVVVLERGRVLLQQGYGVADVARHAPMEPTTMLRAGELSNLVIAVAVLQQVERHRLSLDGDLSQYLDIKIPAGPGPAVTLRALLTQTGGFEADAAIRCSSSELRNLRQYLVCARPRRVHEPGTVPASSRYGMALAAYAVQRAADVPFAAYAERSVFAPLGMKDSSFQQPLPPRLLEKMSQGYRASTRPPLRPEFVFPPSSGMVTSAADMGLFGEMLLNGGELNGRRVLQPGSVALLLSRQFGPVAQLPGMALGCRQVWFNGLHFYGEQGDTAAFHTEFDVDPEQQLLIFIGYNSSGPKGRVEAFSRGEIVHGILDRYHPFHPAMENLHPPKFPLKGMNATWVSSTTVQSGRLGLLSLLRQYRSSIGSDGVLRVNRFISDRNTVKRWLPVAPGVWQQYPQDRIGVMRLKNSGTVVMLLAANPEMALERVRWFDDVRVVTPATAIALMILVIAGISALREAIPAHGGRARMERVWAAGLWTASIASLGLLPFLLQQYRPLAAVWLQSAVFLLASAASVFTAVRLLHDLSGQHCTFKTKLSDVAVLCAMAWLITFTIRWRLFWPLR